ncbi:hypothetical protein MRX96_026518 [Rhipicephalus microplus]
MRILVATVFLGLASYALADGLHHLDIAKVGNVGYVARGPWGHPVPPERCPESPSLQHRVVQPAVTVTEQQPAVTVTQTQQRVVQPATVVSHVPGIAVTQQRVVRPGGVAVSHIPGSVYTTQGAYGVGGLLLHHPGQAVTTVHPGAAYGYGAVAYRPGQAITTVRPGSAYGYGAVSYQPGSTVTTYRPGTAYNINAVTYQPGSAVTTVKPGAAYGAGTLTYQPGSAITSVRPGSAAYGVTTVTQPGSAVVEHTPGYIYGLGYGTRTIGVPEIHYHTRPVNFGYGYGLGGTRYGTLYHPGAVVHSEGLGLLHTPGAAVVHHVPGAAVTTYKTATVSTPGTAVVHTAPGPAITTYRTATLTAPGSAVVQQVPGVTTYRTATVTSPGGAVVQQVPGVTTYRTSTVTAPGGAVVQQVPGITTYRTATVTTPGRAVVQQVPGVTTYRTSTVTAPGAAVVQQPGVAVTGVRTYTVPGSAVVQQIPGVTTYRTGTITTPGSAIVQQVPGAVTTYKTATISAPTATVVQRPGTVTTYRTATISAPSATVVQQPGITTYGATALQQPDIHVLHHPAVATGTLVAPVSTGSCDNVQNYGHRCSGPLSTRSQEPSCIPPAVATTVVGQPAGAVGVTPGQSIMFGVGGLRYAGDIDAAVQGALHGAALIQAAPAPVAVTNVLPGAVTYTGAAVPASAAVLHHVPTEAELRQLITYGYGYGLGGVRYSHATTPATVVTSPTQVVHEAAPAVVTSHALPAAVQHYTQRFISYGPHHHPEIHRGPKRPAPSDSQEEIDGNLDVQEPFRNAQTDDYDENFTEPRRAIFYLFPRYPLHFFALADVTRRVPGVARTGLDAKPGMPCSRSQSRKTHTQVSGRGSKFSSATRSNNGSHRKVESESVPSPRRRSRRTVRFDATDLGPMATATGIKDDEAARLNLKTLRELSKQELPSSQQATT